MELGAAGLQEQPFRTHGKPPAFVRYAAHEAALNFLHWTYENSQGLGLFLGPSLSGKTTILRQFADELNSDVAVAIVDGAGLDSTELLEAILAQYGYHFECNGTNELISMMKVFTMQQTASGHPPLLIVEHTHAMNPGTLRMLCELANVKVKRSSALRMIFASDRPVRSIIDAPAMECIGNRMTGEFFLQPMECSEVGDYLYAKLAASGAKGPAKIFPRSVCNELHSASGGWPGIVDRLALLALAKAPHCPIRKGHIEHPEIPDCTSVQPASTPTGNPKTETNNRVAVQKDAPPIIHLSINGKTVKKVILDQSRILIGRSEYNDLHIESRFISRHHALLIRQGSTTFLMDLNSTNGTSVNSRQITNHVMMHDDVISVGHHSIKFDYPAATACGEVDVVRLDQTIVMKNLEDKRRQLAQKNTRKLAGKSKDSIVTADGDSKSA